MMTGSQRGSVMGDRRQSEVGSMVSFATANTGASRWTLSSLNSPLVLRPHTFALCTRHHRYKQQLSTGPSARGFEVDVLQACFVENGTSKGVGMTSGGARLQVLSASRGAAANRVPESDRPAWRCQGEDSTGLPHGTHSCYLSCCERHEGQVLHR